MEIATNLLSSNTEHSASLRAPNLSRLKPRSEAMVKMKAMEFTHKLNLQPVIRPVPEPQAGEILIQVSAVAVMPTEKLWSTTSHYADCTARSKAIPGHEFSGIVAGLGAGVTGYSLGDAVFGFNDWYAEGATAEFCITKPSNLSLKPSSLSHIEAASVPISLLRHGRDCMSKQNYRKANE